MDATDFFDEVDRSLRENKSPDKEGVGWFISDMEALFDKWGDGGDGDDEG